MEIVKPTDTGTAVRAIEDGELVVVPTSRWYMLCCDATNQDACARIFAAKRRPADRPLLLVVPSPDAALHHFSPTVGAEALMNSFWPGDLGLILRWRDPGVAQRYAAIGAPEALVTQPAGVLGEMASRTDRLIAATSANISGSGDPDDLGPAITVDEVTDFITATGIDIAVVVDGGICPAASHLTIVDCSVEPARLVRQGIVHERAVRAALGRSVMARS